MRAVVLYHPNSDHSGMVEDYKRDFKELKGQKLELLSLETIKGAQMSELYGIDIYPAILVIAFDGGLEKVWQGLPLPLMDELYGYMTA